MQNDLWDIGAAGEGDGASFIHDFDTGLHDRAECWTWTRSNARSWSKGDQFLIYSIYIIFYYRIFFFAALRMQSWWSGEQYSYDIFLIYDMIEIFGNLFFIKKFRMDDLILIINIKASCTLAILQAWKAAPLLSNFNC